MVALFCNFNGNPGFNKDGAPDFLPFVTSMNRLFAFLLAVAVFPASAREPVQPFEKRPDSNSIAFAGSAKIDSLIDARLKSLGIPAAHPCSDAVFLRRIYLDLLGILPTAEEVVAFLNDPSLIKRSLLIDCLLERDEFTDFLGMKWCDLLRVKSEFPVNLWPEAAQAYDHWIRAELKQNRSYSEFARELLTANGSNFRSPPVNFYRSAGGKDAQSLARAVALTFMGERTGSWPKAKQEGMAAFFSQVGFKGTQEWKEEILFFKGVDQASNLRTKGLFPDGTTVTFLPDKDPRELFVVWLIQSKHSPFARNAVNRTWFFLFNRGIIQEPDDSRPDNPPSHPELLNWLAQELINSHYNMKKIYRLILNSAAYQRSSIPLTDDPRAEANFAYYPIHGLEAEVLIDGLDQLTGGKEEYSNLTPEPTTFLPETQRAITLPDGSINSTFLELFGRPPRDTGFLLERRDRPTAAQRLYLLNSSTLQSKFSNSQKLRSLFKPGMPPVQMVTQLYLTLLSRYPTEEEVRAVNVYTQSSEVKGQAVIQDLAWALMNSPEFLYHH